MELPDQESKLTELVGGKTVQNIVMNNTHELVVESDKSLRLFVDSSSPLELSITGDDDNHWN